MTIQTVAPSSVASLASASQWPAQGQWRYDDYLRLPDDGKRYEIIAGVLYVANAPSYEHQFTVAETIFFLRSFVGQHQLGVVLPAPFEVHLSETTRPAQPDVLFIRADRQPGHGTQFFVGAPDLIVEVLSPSSIRLDRQIKFDAYEQASVAEYWIADPKTRSVEVYTLSNNEYALLGQYTADELIESSVLAGLRLKTSGLFPPTTPTTSTAP
jgi:Uma2 family endonuclease